MDSKVDVIMLLVSFKDRKTTSVAMTLSSHKWSINRANELFNPS